MKIQGFEVICYGVRYKVGRITKLMPVCTDCPIYSVSKRHPCKPTWRGFGFMPDNSKTCKIKDLTLSHGKQKK